MPHPYIPSAVLLALVPLAHALGSANIQNNCNFPIYAWSVSDTQGAMNTLASNGGTYEEQYRTNPNGGGVSIKVAAAPSLAGPITQFEYTLESTLWFDISNVNGSPFLDQGLTVRAKPESSACRPITCEPGSTCGTQIYNEPNDDFAVSACTPDQDIVLVVCSGGSGSGSGSVPASVISTPPVTTSAAAPIPPSAAATPAPVSAAAASNLLSWENVQPPAPAAATSSLEAYYVTVWTTAYVTTNLAHAVAPTAAPAFTPTERFTTIDSWVVDTTFSTAYFTAVSDVIDTIIVPAAAAPTT